MRNPFCFHCFVLRLRFIWLLDIQFCAWKNTRFASGQDKIGQDQGANVGGRSGHLLMLFGVRNGGSQGERLKRQERAGPVCGPIERI